MNATSKPLSMLHGSKEPVNPQVTLHMLFCTGQVLLLGWSTEFTHQPWAKALGGPIRPVAWCHRLANVTTFTR